MHPYVQVKKEAWGIRTWKGNADAEAKLIGQTEKPEWLRMSLKEPAEAAGPS